MKQHQAILPGTATVKNNEQRSRYELSVDAEPAGHLEYRIEGDTVRMTHTEVDSHYRGQGLASKLVAQALDDVRRQGRRVRPQCRFVAGFIARHEKEYGGLVDKG